MRTVIRWRTWADPLSRDFLFDLENGTIVHPSGLFATPLIEDQLFAPAKLEYATGFQYAVWYSIQFQGNTIRDLCIVIDVRKFSEYGEWVKVENPVRSSRSVQRFHDAREIAQRPRRSVRLVLPTLNFVSVASRTREARHGEHDEHFSVSGRAAAYRRLPGRATEGNCQ